MAYLGNSPVLSQQEYRNIDNISGSFNGVTTSFALLVNGVAPVPAPQSSNQCLISVNGVVQKPDDTGATGFRISGGNIIFSSAPTGGQSFFGVILAGADYIYAGENFPDGTVSAPSITFAQDLDTGFFRSGAGEIKYTANGTAVVTLSSNNLTAPSFIPTSSSAPTNGVYLPAANTVGISTGGSGRLFVDASGNVGAGTSSPAFAAGGGIQAKYATFSSFRATVGANTGTDFSAGSDGKGYVYVRDNADLLIGTNNSERLRITSAGLVGIGSSSPDVLITAKQTNAGATGATLRLVNASTTVNSATKLAFTNTTSETADSAAITAVRTASGQYMAFGIEGTEAVRIDESRRVGIGTASPEANANLTVYGAGIAISKTSSTVSPSTYDLKIRSADPKIGVHVTGSAQTTTLEFGTAGDNANGAFINVTGADPLRFGTNNSEKARLTSDGRWLVGTSTSYANYGTPLLQLDNSSGAELSLRRSITTDATNLGYITAYSTHGLCSSIQPKTDGTQTASSTPGAITFHTQASGSTGSPTERFRINNAGSFSAVIPSGSTLYPGFWCRAWISFDGTSASIGTGRGSGNVSSVTDNGAGDYTVNFTTAMPDANYCCNVTGGDTPTINRIGHVYSGTRATGSIRVATVNSSGGLTDSNDVNVSIFR